METRHNRRHPPFKNYSPQRNYSIPSWTKMRTYLRHLPLDLGPYLHLFRHHRRRVHLRLRLQLPRRPVHHLGKARKFELQSKGWQIEVRAEDIKLTTGFFLLEDANSFFEPIPFTDHTRHASDLKFVPGGAYGYYFFFYQGDFFYFPPKPIYPGVLVWPPGVKNRQKSWINRLWGEISKIALAQQKVLTTRTSMQKFQVAGMSGMVCNGYGLEKGG